MNPPPKKKCTKKLYKNSATGKLWGITPQTPLTAANEIESKMLIGLTLHLALMSKRKSKITFPTLSESAFSHAINLVNSSTGTPSK